MKKIINPWRNHEGYNCFGCSPDNPIGLDMQKLNENKQRFLQEIEPKWIEEAKKNGKLIEI